MSQSTNDVILREALAEREQLLRSRPELRAYQAEIDSILDKSGDAHGRMAVLATLMQGKLLEMRDELININNCLWQIV